MYEHESRPGEHAASARPSRPLGADSSDDPLSWSPPADRSIMPGGGISRRPLHMIIVADCSNSMKGEKMQALNFAIADMLPHLADWERDQERAEIMVRVLAFATTPFWHVAEPVPVAQMRWKPLSFVHKGWTNLAPALQLVADALAPGHLERRALRPALLLITDGAPTDPPDQLDAAFSALDAVPAGRSALRLAVAIGRDANTESLTRFIGDGTVPVLMADHTDEIAERLAVASIAVSRLSDIGVDREAIVQQLLRPDTRPGPFDPETVI